MDTQPGVEDPAKRPAYDQMMAAWMAPDGPPQEVADAVAAIILGPGYAGARSWQEKWVAMPKHDVQQNYDTLMGREDDVTARLGELAMPALVVHGEQDVAIDLAAARALADALPAGELVVVPGAGHAANLTHPEPVNEAIERFLAGVA
jgi:pimeloyl-ACP methyl ester carboxylesterase